MRKYSVRNGVAPDGHVGILRKLLPGFGLGAGTVPGSQSRGT